MDWFPLSASSGKGVLTSIIEQYTLLFSRDFLNLLITVCETWRLVSTYRNRAK
jgi:hypothetical protein